MDTNHSSHHIANCTHDFRVAAYSVVCRDLKILGKFNYKPKSTFYITIFYIIILYFSDRVHALH